MSSSTSPPLATSEQPPTTSNPPPPPPQSQLASLLAQTLVDLERITKERDAALQRATNAEQLLLTSPSQSDPHNASATIANLQARHSHQQRTIADLSTRLKNVSEAFSHYERWTGTLEVRSADARTAFTRTLAALTGGESLDAIHMFNPPDIPTFQSPLPIPKSRRSSRSQRSDSFSQLQIPPGAPGGPPTSSSGVPSNLPPIPITPSGVLAGRVRQRPTSAISSADDLSRQNRDDRFRAAQDDHESADPDGERQSKRLRSDAGPSTARRERTRFSDSPQPPPSHLNTQYHPQSNPAYPSAARPSLVTHPLNGLAHDHPKHPSSDSPQSHFRSSPTDSRSHRGSETTLVTPSSTRGSGPNPYPLPSYIREEQRMSSTDSLTSIAGGQVVSSPPPMDAYHRRFSATTAEHSALSVEASGQLSNDDNAIRRREQDRQRQRLHQERSAAENDAMDVDQRLEDPSQAETQLDSQAHPGPGHGRLSAQTSPQSLRRSKDGPGDHDENDSVQEFFLETLQYDDTEQDQLGDEDAPVDDRLLSPRSRGRSPGFTNTAGRGEVDLREMEKWKERDRLRQPSRGRENLSFDAHQSENRELGHPEGLPSQQFVHSTDQGSLVKNKDRGDRFRHYAPHPSQPAHLQLTHSNLQPHPQPHSAQQLGSGSHYPPTPHHPTHAYTHPPPHGRSHPQSASAVSDSFPMNQREVRRGTVGPGSLPPPGGPRPPSSAPNSASPYPSSATARRHSLSVAAADGTGYPLTAMHNAAPGASSASLPNAGGSSTSILYPHTQPRHTGPGPAVKPSLNAQGQRTCRQCGQPGRYKDGKCVEKWGPGPAGPGTVCDKCRKKMKRVERRGTHDAAALGHHLPVASLSNDPHAPSQSLSPRQHFAPHHASGPPTPAAYPRGQHYADGQSQREYHFQEPLSSASSWGRGSVSKEQWESRNAIAKPPKEKRKTPSFSPTPPGSPSHRPTSNSRDDEPDSTIVAPSGNSSSPASSRKDSAGEANGMESAAADLEVEFVGKTRATTSPAVPGIASPLPYATKVKDNDSKEQYTALAGGDDEGDLEDALGEDDDSPPEIEHVASASPSGKGSRPPSSLSVLSAQRGKEAGSSWVKVEEGTVIG